MSEALYQALLLGVRAHQAMQAAGNPGCAASEQVAIAWMAYWDAVTALPSDEVWRAAEFMTDLATNTPRR